MDRNCSELVKATLPNGASPAHWRRTAAAFACACALAAGLAGCAPQEDPSASAGAADDAAVSVEVVSDGFADIANMDFTYSERDLDASWDEASATAIELGAEEVVTVSEAGTYVLTGTLADGQVVVDADEAEVQLVLAGATIRNEDGPAIHVASAGKVYLTLAEGTENVLSDGAEYVLEEGEDEPNATLYSKADLCINGSGALAVKGAYDHAINSKDALIITGGTFDITAVGDGLRGKDCVKIADGSFDIEVEGDGIKSNNDEDFTRGFVSIDGGDFAIEAGDDAVKTFTYYRVMDGTLHIVAGDDAFNSDSDGRIAGGTLVIDAVGDAFHTEFCLVIDEGEVNVITCDEGYEGQKVYVNGGTTHIVSVDDGINAATGELPEEMALTTDATADAAAEDPMAKANEDCLIQINGGYVVIDAGGDAIDSNGYIEMNGGIVLAEGPTASADAAFDYDYGATLTGGTMIMVSSSNMEMGFTEATQPFGMVRVSGKPGDTISLVAQSGDMAEYGELLASYTAKRDFVTVTVTSPALTEGIEYELVVGAHVPDANADGFADGGTVTGGTAMAFVAELKAAGGMGGPGGMMPGGAGGPGGTLPEDMDGTFPEGTLPEGATPPDGDTGGTPPAAPDGATPPDGFDGATPPEKPQGGEGFPRTSA